MTMKVYLKNAKEVGFVPSRKQLLTELNPNEVLIKIISVSICGTDLHIYNWDEWSQNRIKPPLTVGHEFSGEVIKVGSEVTKVKVGDIVSSESHIVCGVCDYCKSGNGHICPNTKVIGVDVDGCFAEYIKLPEANLFIDNSGLDPIYLSVLEPLGNAVHAVNKFDVKDKDVVIIGCGPLGLMGVDVAKANGAKTVIVSEVNEYRLNLAKEIGADYTINPLKEDVVAKVREYTNNEGADVVIDFAGNIDAINDALEYIKPGGGLSILGVFNQKINLDLNNIVFKGLNIYGVTGRLLPKTWEDVDRLLKSKKLHFNKFVTHVLPFDELEKGIEIMKKGKSGKIILKLWKKIILH